MGLSGEQIVQLFASPKNWQYFFDYLAKWQLANR
jgi:hypothetical protein